jgi:hypothetical protein
MEFSRKKSIIAATILLSLFILYGAFTFFSAVHKVSSKDFVYDAASLAGAVGSSNVQVVPQPLSNPPAVIKAVYMTGWSAGNKNYLTYLQSLFTATQINAVVIDVKDYSGMVSYKTNAKLAKAYKAYWPEIPDINALINNLHSQGIYVIGRVVVFEDPMLAKNRPDLAIYDTSKTKDTLHPVIWQNNDGLYWVDPASKDVWDYNIAIAKDAASHGFDEINFDYVRFPTDGNAGNMGFPVWNQKIQKHVVIKNFFQTLRDSFPYTKISADVFGQTTTNTDDMGIGQVFEDSLSYFDYVCPMVYPSHYINGFLGYKNPAEKPYEIITYAMNGAVARQKVFAKVQAATANKLNADMSNPLSQPAGQPTNKLAKIRPWLQDFNLGAIYNADMVKKEIQAVTDSIGTDFSGYLLWNPSNIYTKDAIALGAAPNAPK